MLLCCKLAGIAAGVTANCAKPSIAIWMGACVMHVQRIAPAHGCHCRPVQVGKAYATRASRAASKKDALALQEEGLARLQAVFSRGSYAGEGHVGCRGARAGHVFAGSQVQPGSSLGFDVLVMSADHLLPHPSCNPADSHAPPTAPVTALRTTPTRPLPQWMS